MQNALCWMETIAKGITRPKILEKNLREKVFFRKRVMIQAGTGYNGCPRKIARS